ncbi:hypothetical protein [Massilioclostridium coli]|uniref:hypothetical protein n=1 Tax=Massilioclostridium coli TaxID=1870991 RepID=UPI00085C1A12|nr:hypothetical protein [Massilioclostridium coli]
MEPIPEIRPRDQDKLEQLQRLLQSLLEAIQQGDVLFSVSKGDLKEIGARFDEYENLTPDNLFESYVSDDRIILHVLNENEFCPYVESCGNECETCPCRRCERSQE